jgi:hypothetical protein
MLTLQAIGRVDARQLREHELRPARPLTKFRLDAITNKQARDGAEVTTLEACEITRPSAADRPKVRVAVFAPSTRGVVTAIGRSLSRRLGRREGAALEAPLPSADTYHSILEQVQPVHRRGWP